MLCVGGAVGKSLYVLDMEGVMVAFDIQGKHSDPADRDNNSKWQPGGWPGHG